MDSCDLDPLLLPAGLTLAEVEAAMIRASFARNGGIRCRVSAELQISKSSLLRKLTKLGLRTPRKPRHLQEADIARSFRRHRRRLVAELGILDATFVRWLNKNAPFEPLEETP